MSPYIPLITGAFGMLAGVLLTRYMIKALPPPPVPQVQHLSEKHRAYFELNLVVALLAKMLLWYTNVQVGRGYDAHFAAWGTVLYIETPQLGQLCWHFHDSHKWMVDLVTDLPHDRPWDGRTKEQKYAAIESWLRQTQLTERAPV